MFWAHLFWAWERKDGNYFCFMVAQPEMLFCTSTPQYYIALGLGTSSCTGINKCLTWTTKVSAALQNAHDSLPLSPKIRQIYHDEDVPCGPRPLLFGFLTPLLRSAKRIHPSRPRWVHHATTSTKAPPLGHQSKAINTVGARARMFLLSSQPQQRAVFCGCGV